MSDFDKEAEREKLREKYERDKEERKATQRMSDLLLKGATMTNAHCGTCGDPLFQQNGTTFCPSCHGNPDAVEGTDLEARPADGQSTPEQSTAERSAEEGTVDDGNVRRTDDVSTETDASPPAATDDGADSPTGDGAASAPNRQRDEDGRRDSRTETGASNDASTSRSDPSATGDRQPTSRTDASSVGDAPNQASDGRSTGASRRAPAVTPSSVDGDLEAARDALVRTLEKFAAEAAATDDPRYARDCLEAAREASETLSTLR